MHKSQNSAPKLYPFFIIHHNLHRVRFKDFVVTGRYRLRLNVTARAREKGWENRARGDMASRIARRVSSSHRSFSYSSSCSRPASSVFRWNDAQRKLIYATNFGKQVTREANGTVRMRKTSSLVHNAQNLALQ